MKNWYWTAIVLALGMPSVARAADISTAPVRGQIADWPLVQSKGGIKLGPAIQHTTNSWELPLLCDLSTDASGIVIQKTVVNQDTKDIFISLIISQTLWTLTPQRSQCRPVVVDSSPGLHEVYYRDAAGKTYPIGFANFNLDSTVLNSPPG